MMPLISDIKKDKEKSKIFKKKSYRPWDENELSSFHNIITTIGESDDNISLMDTDKVFIHSTTTHSPLDNFSEQNLKKELRNLFGAQKIVMQYLLNQIEEANDEFVVTKCIVINEFSTMCKLPSNTIKSTLLKLKSKGLLETYEKKPGRGGYARYKFTQNIFTFFTKNINNT
jgi:hypothetical protein